MRYPDFERSALLAVALVASACRPVQKQETPVAPISPSASPCEPGQVDIGTVGPDSKVIPSDGNVLMVFLDGKWVRFKNVKGHVCSSFDEPKFWPPARLEAIAA